MEIHMQVTKEQLALLRNEELSKTYADLTLVCRFDSAINNLLDCEKYNRDFWPEFVQFHERAAQRWLRKFAHNALN